MWEGGTRVPLIVRGPGVKAGACSHIRAITVDIFPTIAALARVREPLPKGLEGGSLKPVLGGAPDAMVKRSREEFVVHFRTTTRTTRVQRRRCCSGTTS